MKLGLVLLVCSFASVGFACPNLQGNWHCVSDSQTTSDFAATQKDVPGGVVYTMTGAQGTQDFYVDGVTRNTTADDGSTITSTWTCTASPGSGFSGVLHFEAADKSYSADATVTDTMPDANSINGSTVGVFYSPGQPDQPQNSSEACTRQ